MSVSHAFNAGWNDRLMSLPVPAKYERCRTGLAVAYERGRHCAALWEYCVSTAMRDVGISAGTIHAIEPSNPPPSFTKAFRTMPKELRALIRAEKKFCSLKPPRWSY